MTEAQHAAVATAREALRTIGCYLDGELLAHALELPPGHTILARDIRESECKTLMQVVDEAAAALDSIR